MVRVRHAVMAVALGSGAMGCAFTQSPSNVAHYSIWHCSECDDFPTPAYGPGFSMMPGSYTGIAGQNQKSTESKPATNNALDPGAVPPPGQAPAPTAPPTTVTPPPPPAAASPGLGVNLSQPTVGGPSLANTMVTGATSDLPSLPSGMPGNLQVPVANR